MDKLRTNRELELIKERNQLKDEVIALKSQVNLLRTALDLGFNSDNDHDLDKWESLTRSVLTYTPEQCLNSVKADAIDTLGNIMEREFGGHTGSFVRLYVDKLRSNNG